ncbi:hypothetical protein [Stenotrophomonas sp. RAC2]|uniref:hypothetical protein n=1 Tax=Stenotrophomonas sp. RAC2 TaxID=3064902 RepID=UPI0013103287|nr:hypothetical protein [Stenotrophomonas sp. RAC2]MDV9042053.1 hypothetical protein [Stenotrophomonas sp. RAC2]
MAVRRWPGRHGRATPVPGRHFDDGRSLQAFADRVAVCCHRCDTPGWVIASWEPYRWTARFRCTACSAALDSGDWVGTVCILGRQPCGFCGHQWLHVRRRIPVGMPAPASFPARCAQCDRSTEVTVSTRPLRDAEPADPHFGLPLRLVESTRAGLLWAYNAEHLQALHAYASATLREHRGHHRSMFSRLPQWMKLARNRVLLQRAVERLQRRLLQG